MLEKNLFTKGMVEATDGRSAGQITKDIIAGAAIMAVKAVVGTPDEKNQLKRQEEAAAKTESLVTATTYTAAVVGVLTVVPLVGIAKELFRPTDTTK